MDQKRLNFTVNLEISLLPSTDQDNATNFALSFKLCLCFKHIKTLIRALLQEKPLECLLNKFGNLWILDLRARLSNFLLRTANVHLTKSFRKQKRYNKAQETKSCMLSQPGVTRKGKIIRQRGVRNDKWKGTDNSKVSSKIGLRLLLTTRVLASGWEG